MELDLGELRSFVVLADQLHYGRAAELLHISQPALTKQMQRLEARIGGALIKREYRRVTLTQAGQVLRERARQLLHDAERAAEMSRLAVQGEAGLLRVGFGIASLAAGLPELVLSFRQRHPHVHLTMRDMSTSDQIEALLSGEIDVGFVRLPIRDPSIMTVPMLEERLVIAYSPKTPFHSGAAALSSFRAAPFVVCSRSTSTSMFDHIVSTCRAGGFAPRIVQEVNEIFTVLHLVRAGLGGPELRAADAHSAGQVRGDPRRGSEVVGRNRVEARGANVDSDRPVCEFGAGAERGRCKDVRTSDARQSRNSNVRAGSKAGCSQNWLPHKLEHHSGDSVFSMRRSTRTE
jgi:DNA-binding transcriptional LysR family regulator